MFFRLNIILITIFIILSPVCYASSEEKIVMSIDSTDTDISFSDLYSKIKSGEFSLSPSSFMKYIVEMFLGEMKDVLKMLKYIMIIVCINAFVTNFNTAFVSKGINNAVYLACFSVFIILTSKTFSSAAEICISLITKVCIMLKTAVPVCISLIASLGEITGKMALKPVYLYFLEFISEFSKNFIIPVINAFFTLSTVGCMSNHFSINNLTELLKKIIKWTMTATISIFIGSVGILGIITDKVVFKGTKGLKFLVGNFVPVVGRMLSDTIETVTASAVLIKNSVGVTGIIMIAIICIPPIIKLFAIAFSYKLCSAIIEPICDRRLSLMLSVLSSSVELMLGISISIAFVFSISLSVLLTIGG